MQVGAIAGLAVIVGGLALLFWPMSRPGVAGSAALPRYHDFGWYGYSPLPQHPTSSDFRQAGVSLPQDAVKKRRLVTVALAGVGVVAIAAARWGQSVVH